MPGLPRSLRGRTLLLTVIGIIAAELVTFGVLGWYRHNLLAGRAREFVSGQLEMVRAALTHASPQEVASELERARRRGPPRTIDNPSGDAPPPDRPLGDEQPPPPDARRFQRGDAAGMPRPMRLHLVERPPPEATSQPPDDFGLSALITTLREEYGADSLRFTESPESAVWVHMSPDGWWAVFPFSRYSSPPIPWSIIIATLAVVAVMSSLVGLYSFHLSRPLRALADAASRYKVGQRPDLALTGPDEIQAVTAQFNAMAERLDRDEAERRVMLAGLPHDLRAPLARAKLRLELMDDGPDSPKAGLTRDLTEVEGIADQFVAYLRGLDHDTTRFSPTPLDELIRDRGLVWRESGHDVTITRDDALVRDADADALLRAIDNLVGNAFAHGAPPVTISGELVGSGDAQRYRIVVRDHGPGIPEDRRAEALKPFTRLDAARGASGHCGLGLAVVHSVARLHGGHVELEAPAGGGLAAVMVLPTRV